MAEDRVLWLFRRRSYSERDTVPERRLMEEMDRAITRNTGEIDVRTVAIISLARSAGLLRLIFDKRTLQRHTVRIEKRVNGDWVRKASQEAIAAMQDALSWRPPSCRRSRLAWCASKDARRPVEQVSGTPPSQQMTAP